MKGTVTRLRLLSLAAAVLVVAAAIAVAATPRRTPQTAAPQPAVAAVVHATAPVAPAVVAPVAKAAPVVHRAPMTVASEAPAVQSSMGLMIYRDPETGDIGMGSPDQVIGAPGFELNDSDEGLIEETAWDGSKFVNLQGRFQEVSVMRMGTDGRMYMECSKHPVLGTVAGPAPAPQYEER